MLVLRIVVHGADDPDIYVRSRLLYVCELLVYPAVSVAEDETVLVLQFQQTVAGVHAHMLEDLRHHALRGIRHRVLDELLSEDLLPDLYDELLERRTLLVLRVVQDVPVDQIELVHPLSVPIRHRLDLRVVRHHVERILHQGLDRQVIGRDESFGEGSGDTYRYLVFDDVFLEYRSPVLHHRVVDRGQEHVRDPVAPERGFHIVDESVETAVQTGVDGGHEGIHERYTVVDIGVHPYPAVF